MLMALGSLRNADKDSANKYSTRIYAKTTMWYYAENTTNTEIKDTVLKAGSILHCVDRLSP